MVASRRRIWNIGHISIKYNEIRGPFFSQGLYYVSEISQMYFTGCK